MPASIHSIPVEILSHIFGFIEDVKTLRNAAFSSRNFHKIAIPHLYSKLELQTSWNAPCKELRPLTCVLLEKPDIARHIRHFAIRGASTSRFYSANNNNIEVEPQLRDAITASAQNEEEKKLWMERAREADDIDCILSLALPAMRNLRILDLEIPELQGYVLRQLLRVGKDEHPYDKDPTLQHLESFFISHRDEKYGMTSGDIVPALLLPGLKHLYLHRVGEYDKGDHAEELKEISKRASPITSIGMRNCKFSSSDMDSILKSCKALTSFCYEMGVGPFCRASLPALRESLEFHKDTLQDLWLDFTTFGSHWMNDVDDTRAMRSFANFSALKRVKIAMVYLFGEYPEGEIEYLQNVLVDKLPPQIEYVRILHCEDGPAVIAEALDMLIVQKESKFQNLKKLSIEVSQICVDTDPLAFKRLVERAKNEELDFAIINNPSELNDTVYEHLIERKWGFDEDMEFMPCGSQRNMRPPLQVHMFRD
ncbi:MAG: hypothetical protein M1821_008395 [Bathelium mastoideum]|nr:MAG: hypothetical protein M1821_008395 [Bathelium mastoideum]